MSSISKALTHLSIAILLILVVAINTATAATLTVSPDGSRDFTSIQKAVDTAKNSDIIVVYPGTYKENVTISLEADKAGLPRPVLTLKGISYPTISGKFMLKDHYGGNDKVNISIRGFIFSGSFLTNYCNFGNGNITIDDNKFTNTFSGIYSRSTNIVISNNEFQNTSILVTDESTASIIHNTFSSCTSYAIYMLYNGRVTITDNTFSNNLNGIREKPVSINDVSGPNLIENNRFSGNDVGLLCYGQSTTVKNNNFTNNKKAIELHEGKFDVIGNRLELNDIGIYLPTHPPLNSYIGESKIYNNYFNNNVNVAGDFNNNTCIWNISKTNGVNIAGGPYLGGNFWGKPDLSGFSQITPDINNDGFCDLEYIVGGNKIDRLPLAETPVQQIQHMINQIQNLYSSGKLDRQKSTILLAELNLIKKSIKAGKNNAAVAELDLFKLNVKTYIKKGILSSTDGKTLINGANNIINDLK